MAFDRPLEADLVDDVGFFGSLVRAPVVGIIWLLGGERAEEESAEVGGTEERQSSEDSYHEHDDVGGEGGEGGCSPKGNSASLFCREREKSAVAIDPPPDDVLSPSLATSAPSGQSDDQAEVHGNGKNRPSVDYSRFDGGDKKTMSWSDESGNRSLVEYFDDAAAAPSRSSHWSAMRRSCRRASRPGFDGGDKRSPGPAPHSGVLKSVLKRSGSYSPPASSLHARNSGGNASSTSTDFPCASSSSSPEMRSLRSIPAMGSSDTSRSGPSNQTHKEPNGPEDTRSCFPRGGRDDPRHRIILGAGTPSAHEETKTAGDQDADGYISPQYGFYVNITQRSLETHHASGTRTNLMRPAFTKNKKGMGMLLAENPHHGVWPTVPFG